MLIAREKEIKQIYEIASSKKFEFLVMYGRRRVGKTELLKELARNKRTIFFSAQEKNNLLNLKEFSQLIQTYFEGKNIAEYNSWENIFEYLADKVSKSKQRTILIIDEFPYIVNEYPTIKSILQHYIDHIFSKLNLLIILCGSSISSMEDGILAKKSPLYGRATSIMEVKPLNCFDSFKFMGGYNIVDKMIAYSILGGIPYYLKEFDYSKSIISNLEKKVLQENSILRYEPQILLKMELREPALYNSILEAIGSNRNRLNEIAEMVHEESYKCSKYISTLMKLRIVNKCHPCGEKDNTKKSIYEISDFYFYFWYRYIFKNRSYYELLGENIAAKEIYSDISNYMGKMFEKISLEYMIELAKQNKLPFIPAYYGKWWGTNKTTKKQDDVDILMIDKSKKKGIFCECKFKNEKLDLSDYKDLKTASDNFSYINEKYYYLISKGGFTKDVLDIKNDNLRLIALDDIKEFCK